MKIIQQIFVRGVTRLILYSRMENGKLLVPEQVVGSHLDLQSERICADLTEAMLFFTRVSNRLMNVNQWDEFCKTPSSVFKLINEKGQAIAGLVKEGDFIRIDIPGLGTKIGDGYDWVRVESIAEELLPNGELLSITVRPSSHPLKKTSEIAHFFNDEATSTFQVKRVDRVVYAEIHGRNELPNVNTSVMIDNIRNTLVGWVVKLGFSYPQWKCLANGLIEEANKTH